MHEPERFRALKTRRRVSARFLGNPTRPTVAQYLLPVACTLPALVPMLVAGWRGLPAGLLLLTAAVLLSGLYGGARSGLIAAVIGSSSNLILALHSFSAWAASSLIAVLQAAVFAAIALGIVIVCEQRRRTGHDLQFYLGLTGAIAYDPNEGVCVLDRDGFVAFASPPVTRILRLPDRDIVGANLHQAMHRHSGLNCSEPTLRCPLRHLLSIPVALGTGEEELVTREGERRSIAYVCAPMERNGSAWGVVLRLRDVTDESRTVESLRASEEWYRRMVETSPDAIVGVDPYGYVLLVNARAVELFGFADEPALIGSRFIELVASENRLHFAETAREVSQRGTANVEFHGVRSDGKQFPIEVRASVLADEAGAPRATMYVCRDLTVEHRTAEALRINERCATLQHEAVLALARSVTHGEAYLNVLEALCTTMEWDLGTLWMLEEHGAILRCQQLWHEPSLDITGFDQVTRSMDLMPGQDLPGRVWGGGRYIWVPDCLLDTGFPRALVAAQVDLHTAFCLPVVIGGAVQGVIELFSRAVREENTEMVQTITTIAAQLAQFVERKDAERALEYQARHDVLTDLPNRFLLQERMKRVLQASSPGTTHALLLMDLDRFKEVNDTLGHHLGDLLLQHVSKRLQEVIRDTDTVARLGGDEFAILLPGADVVGASLVAQKILDAVEEPYWVDRRHIDVGTSIGIAVYPHHADDAHTLMQHADVAMYVAKRTKIGYAVYRSEEDGNSPDRLQLMAWLRQAIEQERLIVHYQPKVNVRTGQIESVEALARWHHPQQGDIPPEQFIPLAEQSGLIRPLSYCILNEALRQCRRWRETGTTLGIAVNFSAENLHDPQVAEVVNKTLQTHALPADALTVEITESAIMIDSARAKETLARLHDMGVRISIDDFGTGYSSLAYLKRLPVDEIKIDKSFVLDMADHDDDAFIARSVIDLGHNLGLQVVAEGVRSETIWGILDTMGCDHAQGFYLSEPLSASGLLAWLTGPNPPGNTPTRRFETPIPFEGTGA